MQRLSIIFLLFISPILSAEETSPKKIEKSLKAALKNVASTTVSIKASGLGSGVIISESGLILTAAHLIHSAAQNTSTVSVELSDGTVHKAAIWGYNREADIGILKILSDKKLVLPFASIAKNMPETGDIIFCHSHPGGIIKNRSAQPRLGRITAIIKPIKSPLLFYFSDINIQPGDSGGPVFDLKGDLVAINSSSATKLNFSILTSLSNYHIQSNAYISGKRWGDPKLSPTHSDFLKVDFTPSRLKKIELELFKRADSHHAPTTDFFRSNLTNQGQVSIDREKIISFMGKDAIAIAKRSAVSMSLDDPKILRKLPRPPKGFTSYTIVDSASASKVIARATSLGNNHFVTKSSAIKGVKNLNLKWNKSLQALQVAYQSKSLDLTILKLVSDQKHDSVKLSKKIIPVSAGTALVTPDRHSRQLWSIATDTRNTISQKYPSGLDSNSPLITSYQTPFGPIIRHTLPLYHRDIGTPIFNLKGDFVGIHAGRISRSIGICIPHEYVSLVIQDYKNQKNGE